VQEAISPQDAWLLSERMAAGCQDELVITPRVRAAGLKGSWYLPGLITRFDEKQDSNQKTYVSPPWDQFGDEELPHDYGLPKATVFSAAVLINDNTDPRDVRMAANDYDEAGLVYTDMDAEHQWRGALGAERALHHLARRRIFGVSIGQIIMVNAQRRLAGEPLLDERMRTVTRLPHYPARTVAGSEMLPAVRSDEGRLMLVGTEKGMRQDNIGVRRTLILPLAV
jgi:hypothetical protein